MGDSLLFYFFFTYIHIQAALLCCSGERLCSGDSTHKRAAGQWASQWRAPVERATMAVHAGNWAGWYKGMKPSLRPWRTSFQKRGFVCSLSICRFPWEKTIRTDLKMRILPYPSSLVSLIKRGSRIHFYRRRARCTVETGCENKRWTAVYPLWERCSADNQYF